MLADSIGAREIDLSHLAAQIAHAIPPEASQVAKKSRYYLAIGLGASCVVHALILLVNWRSASVEIPQSEAPVLVIQLQTQVSTPIAQPNPEPVIEQAPIPIQAAIPIQAPIPVETAEPQIIEETAQVVPTSPEIKPEPVIEPFETKTQIEPLSAKELREIIQSHNSESPRAATGTAANVFHPGLRKRLQEEEQKPTPQRGKGGPRTYTDVHGQTIVDLGGGNCLRASAPKIGEPTNWYMTSCAGKSESEQMMDRVNQAVNGKLKFEK